LDQRSRESKECVLGYITGEDKNAKNGYVREWLT